MPIDWQFAATVINAVRSAQFSLSLMSHPSVNCCFNDGFKRGKSEKQSCSGYSHVSSRREMSESMEKRV